MPIHESSLEETIRTLFSEYGVEEVHNAIHAIRDMDKGRSIDKHSTNSNRTITKDTMKRRGKKTAPQYVKGMELPPAKTPSIIELARRFHHKEFLPSFGDVSNFCQIYGIDEPASKTRANAIPRIFKYIAKMDTDEIERMLTERMFSGPSRLKPIAEAIRRKGRASIS